MNSSQRHPRALAALTSAALLGFAALSHAAVIVSEDFTYSDGGLNGQNGGTGFSTAWTSSINVGGGVVGGNAPSTRSLSTAFASSGTLWLTFDWGFDSAPSENASYGGLTFYIGGSETFLIGNTWPGSGHNLWRMSGGGNTSELNYGMKTGVAKITLGAGSTSTVELWVGPTGSSVNVGGAPLATVTTANLAGVNGIRILGTDFGPGFGGGGPNQAIDNFIIGENTFDVDATSSTPTWTNTAGGLWNTGGNWDSAHIGGGSGNTALFDTLNITSDTTVNLDSARTIGYLTFGDTDTSSAAGWTLANNGSPGNVLTLAGATPTITVNALGTAKTVTISAGIAGSNGLNKDGAGTLVLSGSNTFSGPVAVNSGTLQISGQSYFNVGRATTVASGTVLDLYNSNNTFFSLMPVSSVTGAGTFRLSGNSTIDQSVNGVSGTRLTFAMQSGGWIDLQDTSRLVNGGWQELNWTSNLASMNIASGATFDIWDGQAVNIDALTGSGTVDKVHGGNSPSSLTVGVANGSGTFSGTIKNTGGQIALTKEGTGTQTLSGNNTYSGPTTINGGLLVVQNGSAMGDLSSVTLNNSAQLRLDANESVGSLAGGASTGVNLQGNTLQIGDQVGSATVTYDGVITGTGSLVRRGGGTQTLTGNNSFSGSITVRDGGTLSVATAAASGNQPLGAGTGDIGLEAGATLAITGAGTYNLPSTRGLALSGSGGILNVSAGTVNMTADITGASNSAHFTKSGAGTFNFSGSGSWSGNFTVSGGTFNLTGGGSIPGVGSTTVGGTLNINTTGLVRTSSLDILSGGAVNLDAGTLRVGGGGLGVTGRSIDNAGGSFTWGSGTLAVYTTGSGEAGLTDRTGAGGSPSGPAVKEGNYLSVAGSLNAPSGSTLDLGSTFLSNGLRYNQLNVDGNLTLNDGTLNIGLSPYFLRPNTPDSVTVGDWGTMVLVYAEGTMSGTFAQLAGKTVIPGISSDGIGWTQLADIEYTGGGSPFDPSTLNLNEWVIEYRDGSGGNGFNFTQSPGAVVLLHYKVAGSVPEPASAGLLVAGTLLLRALRRRKG